MKMEEYQVYIVPALVILFLIWRSWKFKRVKAKIPQYLSEGGVIVDVRSPGEFKLESYPNSINIPLESIGTGANKLDKNKPIILCCASGMRSGMAAGVLKKNGFKNVINAGAWTSI